MQAILPHIEEIHSPPQPLQLLNAIKDRAYPFFLDSACPSGSLGRFSFLGCDPFLLFKSSKDKVTLKWSAGGEEIFTADPFRVLQDLLAIYNVKGESSDMPFTSGAVGYFSYDLKDRIEKLPDTAKDDLSLPECIMGFYDTVVIYDMAARKAYLASSGLPEMSPQANQARKEARLDAFRRIVSAAGDLHEGGLSISPATASSNFSRPSYAAAVRKAKEYIRNGDIYQVNLSQRFRATPGIGAFGLYCRLRAASPAPFSAYLDFGDLAVLSSSPERFLLKQGDCIQTRPIKGTRPRGADQVSDSRLAAELISSRKDRAEHIMIVDLERNDLGRVCRYGSVRLTEPFQLEKYANVFHLVSTVTGKLREGLGPIDCIRATFPGGSITGAPKIRSMEIIEELEPVKRSVYTGAIGYISFGGNMDTSIVIRTFIVKDEEVFFSVGGGIVADSDPDMEYMETLDKAKGLMQALGVGVQPGAFDRPVLQTKEV